MEAGRGSRAKVAVMKGWVRQRDSGCQSRINLNPKMVNLKSLKSLKTLSSFTSFPLFLSRVCPSPKSPQQRVLLISIGADR